MHENENAKRPWPYQRTPRQPWDGSEPYHPAERLAPPTAGERDIRPADGGMCAEAAERRRARRLARATKGDRGLTSRDRIGAAWAILPAPDAAPVDPVYSLRMAEATADVLARMAREAMPWRCGTKRLHPSVAEFSDAEYRRLMRQARRWAAQGRAIGTAAAAARFPAPADAPAHRSLIVRDTDPPAQVAPTAAQDEEIAHDAIASAWAWARRNGVPTVGAGLVRAIARRRGARHVIHAQRMRDGLSDAVSAKAETATIEDVIETLPETHRAAFRDALARWRAAGSGNAACLKRHKALRTMRTIARMGERFDPLRG